jgi:Protein of unknown function (DUF1579)
MKLRILACAIALAAALLMTVNAALAQNKDDKAKGNNPSPAEMQEMMKKYMELCTPGPAHKYLDQFVGKWETAMKMWMAKDAPPMEMKGTAETRWVMDGRFLLEEESSQFMNMPHRSMLFIGYDNFKKKYIITFFDNMNTAIYSAEGDLDEKNKVMSLVGKMDDPMTGEKDKTVRYVTRVISKDKYVFEAYDLVGTPNEFKVIEATYTRKK